MAEGPLLVESTLWKEDVLADGHSSVWGSLYDPETKRWGYACCRGMQRGAACTSPQAGQAGAAPAAGEDSGQEVTSPDTEDEAETLPWDFSKPPPPPELLPCEAVAGGKLGPYIQHFVHYAIGAWARAEAEGFPGFGEMERASFRGTIEQCKKGVGPLMWRLKKGENLDRGEQQETRRSRETRTSMEGKFVKEKSVLQQLHIMAKGAFDREYVKAHEAYMHLTFGNKMWNLTHVAHVAACTMKGAREYRRNRDSLNTYDMDPVSQTYMHAVKKLVHFCQCIRPNADQSKNVVI
mmetsp:Transcript_113914/g.318232  ORF Transcript_113914/g.318232 Transcript_113914/m.318232 type:complete len:293 (+) Transcript_113914:1-879(+)